MNRVDRENALLASVIKGRGSMRPPDVNDDPELLRRSHDLLHRIVRLRVDLDINHEKLVAFRAIKTSIDWDANEIAQYKQTRGKFVDRCVEPLSQMIEASRELIEMSKELGIDGEVIKSTAALERNMEYMRRYESIRNAQLPGEAGPAV